MAKDKKEGEKPEAEVKLDEKSKSEEKSKLDKKPGLIRKVFPTEKPKGFSPPIIKKDKPQPLVTLAKLLNVSPIILAALKAEYGWKDETSLCQADFVEKATTWTTAKV